MCVKERQGESKDESTVCRAACMCGWCCMCMFGVGGKDSDGDEGGGEGE